MREQLWATTMGKKYESKCNLSMSNNHTISEWVKLSNPRKNK